MRLAKRARHTCNHSGPPRSCLYRRRAVRPVIQPYPVKTTYLCRYADFRVPAREFNILDDFIGLESDRLENAHLRTIASESLSR